MATYQHADWASWPETDTAGKIAKLNQHISEVSLILSGADVSADGKSINRASMVQYHASLLGERARLDSKLDQTVTFGKARIV